MKLGINWTIVRRTNHASCLILPFFVCMTQTMSSANGLCKPDTAYNKLNNTEITYTPVFRFHNAVKIDRKKKPHETKLLFAREFVGRIILYYFLLKTWWQQTLREIHLKDYFRNDHFITFCHGIEAKKFNYFQPENDLSSDKITIKITLISAALFHIFYSQQISLRGWRKISKYCKTLNNYGKRLFARSEMNSSSI